MPDCAKMEGMLPVADSVTEWISAGATCVAAGAAVFTSLAASGYIKKPVYEQLSVGQPS
jgi:hypothetical protein